MKYKALILDIDGTLVPSRPHALPSERVKNAIVEAQKKLTVSIATSRNYVEAHNVISALSLSGFVVVSGGAQIMRVPEKELIWEKRIDRKSLEELAAIAKKVSVGFYANLERNNRWVGIDEHAFVETPLSLFSDVLTQTQSDFLLEAVSSIPHIACHKVTSWEDEDHFVITVTNTEATKQHGIFEVAKRLGIETHEIIGIGDSYNDFPLLMACGLKVAMGNGAAELKAIADFVAPTVTDDGVAVVIEKFILEQ